MTSKMILVNVFLTFTVGGAKATLPFCHDSLTGHGVAVVLAALTGVGRSTIMIIMKAMEDATEVGQAPTIEAPEPRGGWPWEAIDMASPEHCAWIREAVKHYNDAMLPCSAKMVAQRVYELHGAEDPLMKSTKKPLSRVIRWTAGLTSIFHKNHAAALIHAFARMFCMCIHWKSCKCMGKRYGTRART